MVKYKITTLFNNKTITTYTGKDLNLLVSRVPRHLKATRFFLSMNKNIVILDYKEYLKLRRKQQKQITRKRNVELQKRMAL